MQRRLPPRKGLRSLEQGGEEAVDGAKQAGEQGEGLAVVVGDLLADLHGLQKVVPHLQHRRVPAQPHAVFKLKVEAAIVQVAAAHGGIQIVCHHGLAVQKARGELVDPGPGRQQSGVVGAGDRKDHLLVRDVGGHDAHVHPRPGGGAQGGGHGLVDDEVGGGEVEVALGLGDHLQVQVGADGVRGVGGVGIGHHDAPGPFQRGQGLGPEEAEIRRGVLVVPHNEEKDRQAPHRLPPQAQGVVLPVAKALLPVHILVGQVQAADEARHPVDDAQLPVVPVVLVDGQQGQQGLKHPAENAPAVELVGIVGGQGGGRAHPVVDHPHIHPLGSLAGEDLQDLVPQRALGDDEVLQEDIVLGLFQLLQKGRQEGGPGGEVGRLRVSIGRTPGGVAQVPGLLEGIRAVGHQVRGGQAIGQLALQGPLGLRPVVVGVAAAPQNEEHDAADQGNQKDGDDPGDLIGHL